MRTEKRIVFYSRVSLCCGNAGKQTRASKTHLKESFYCPLHHYRYSERKCCRRLSANLLLCFVPKWANALPQYIYFWFSHRNEDVEYKVQQLRIFPLLWKHVIYQSFRFKLLLNLKGISKQDDVCDHYNSFLPLKIQCAGFQYVSQGWCKACWISSISVLVHLRITFMLV